MKQKYPFIRRLPIAGLVLVILLSSAPQKALGQNDKPSIDFFTGVDFSISDNHFILPYFVSLGLTPGFKFDMGNHWQIAAQGGIALTGQFANNWKRLSFSMLVLSKEMKLGPVYLKGSTGLFSNARYGFDLKAFLPVNQWLAFEAQGGCTGYLSTVRGWSMSPMKRFTGTIGGDIYIPRWNTQLRGVIGKYVYTDWGFEAEAMRHFNHTTIGLYAKWSNIPGQFNQEGVSLAKSLTKGMDGGFRVTIMLPPYKRTHRTVNFRPASNFNLTYLIRGAHQYHDANQLYNTDPEENKRDGWFSRDLLQWGSHTMEPDFKYREKEDEE